MKKVKKVKKAQVGDWLNKYGAKSAVDKVNSLMIKKGAERANNKLVAKRIGSNAASHRGLYNAEHAKNSYREDISDMFNLSKIDRLDAIKNKAKGVSSRVKATDVKKQIRRDYKKGGKVKKR